MYRKLFIVLCFLALALAPRAEAREWTIDNHHTQAVFSIGHIVGNVTGFFNQFGGVILDPDLPRGGMIDIEIRVDSVYTGVKQRDDHLRTADFFDVAKFPLMHFTSTKIVPMGDGWYEAHGALTIKDVTKPIVLPFTLTEPVPYPQMPGMECQDVRGFSAHYSLNRLDFGVGDGKFLKMGIVDDAVGINLTGELLSPRADCK